MALASQENTVTFYYTKNSLQMFQVSVKSACALPFNNHKLWKTEFLEIKPQTLYCWNSLIKKI